MGHSKVGIVNYGVGNLRSVANAVSHVGSEVVVSSDPTVLGDCSHLVLPGVGSFPHGTSALGAEETVRLPNVGWLSLKLINTNEPMAAWMFSNSTPEDKFYFVHSFAIGPDCTSAIAQSDYCGISFTSAVANRKLVGTQFHPEKSGESGLKLLRNFINV